MSRSSDYYIVDVPFSRGIEFYGRGSAVDVSSWNNVNELLRCGHLRTPQTVEEWELIIESARGIKRDPFSVTEGGDTR